MAATDRRLVAEGSHYNAEGLTRYFQEHRERLSFDLRDVKLGQVQRGGAPTAFNRVLATQLAAAATESLARREYDVLIGLNKGEITATPLANIVVKKTLDPRLLHLAGVLAR